jgi:hypothetical protein
MNYLKTEIEPILHNSIKWTSSSHSSGHQLHFDSDDEGLTREGGKPVHPICSTVLYLDEGYNHLITPLLHPLASLLYLYYPRITPLLHPCYPPITPSLPPCLSLPHPYYPLYYTLITLLSGVGGPTVITDQLLGGKLAQNGWICFPKTNRLVLFDARYLHGVVPGRGVNPDPTKR